MKYGVKINFKSGGTKVVVLGDPYEYRKQTPVFAIRDDENKQSCHLLTADQIRANWNAWVKDLLPEPTGEYGEDEDNVYERVSEKKAEKRGIEVL